MNNTARYTFMRFSTVLSFLSDSKKCCIPQNLKLARQSEVAFVILSTLFLLGFGHTSVMANNIQIANGQIVEVGSERFIEFDLSWENSWRDGINWDAAWVFVKYRVPAAQGGTGLWRHVWLSTDDNEHNPGSGTGAMINIGTTDISGTPRGMGAFIYRSANGSGTFSTTGTRLSWNFTAQGIASSSRLEIRIFAIEMVYVAEGEFNVGSGGTETGSFRAGGTTTNTFQVTESWTNQTNGPCIGNTSGCLWGISTSGNSTIGDPGNLNQAFPTGFHAFYMMKYSISQQQYVDFLNTLSRSQQQERFSPTNTVGRFMHSGPSQTSPANRNGVRFMSDPGGTAPRVFGNDLNNNGTADEDSDGQWIAMNWISWQDGAAYLDWAGLRPMTELEYEKAARGPVMPTPNEYAWGTASIFTANRYTLDNAGQANEGIASNYSAIVGNANYTTTRPALTAHQGPMRVGVFAANGSNAGRVTAGASFWGIMELSGNVFERPVTVGNLAGRSFTGLHGDGAVDGFGRANVDFWPGINGNTSTTTANQEWDGFTGVTQAAGIGLRGGGWASNTSVTRVSDRSSATSASNTRFSSSGIRGVRSAP